MSTKGCPRPDGPPCYMFQTQTRLSSSAMVSTLFSLAQITNGKPNLFLYLLVAIIDRYFAHSYYRPCQLQG